MSAKRIRRPDRAEGPLDAAETKALAELVELWRGRSLRTDAIDPKAIKPAIKAVYAASDLPAPNVAIAPSPLAAAWAYGAASWLLYIWDGEGAKEFAKWPGRKSPEQVAAIALSAAEGSIERSFYATVAAAMGADIGYAAPTDTGADLRPLYRALCGNIAGQEGIDCAGRWSGAFQGGNLWVQNICYVAAGRDVLGLRLPEHKNFAAWEQAAIHGGMRMMHGRFCIVSDFPERMKVDEQFRPHSPDGPSFRFRDGWEIFHWNGQQVQRDWIVDPDSVDPALAFTWENMDERAALREILGWTRILKKQPLTVIHEDGDPQIGRLVETQFPDEDEKARFVQVMCGTGREFLLRVPPDISTALEAQAWLHGGVNSVIQKWIPPEVRT